MIPARHLVVLAVMAVLAACGRNEDDPGATDGSGAPPRGAAALEACAAGQSDVAALVCDNERLAALDGEIRETLVAEAASVSDAGAQLLVEAQQRWLTTQRVACGVLDPEAELTRDQTRCIEGALRARAREVGDAVREVGGYTFQTVEIAGAEPVTAEAAAAVGLSDADAPAAIVRNIRYPRIDGAATPEAQRFNQIVAQQPQYGLADQTEEQVTYTIAYAGPDLISVRFDMFESTLGAAHPNNSSKAVTVVMRTGQPLTATDVFKAGAGWENFVVERAMAALTRQFAESGFEPPERDVRESATKPHLWLITERGLTILFPPYSFGGPHALGGAEVEIPWRDLRPYLNPEAPAPIRAQA